jgi:hypothetical protein
MAEAWFLRDGLPLWLAALVLAAVAPWCVRALAAHLEQRVSRRTRRVIEAVAESRKEVVPVRVDPEKDPS